MGHLDAWFRVERILTMEIVNHTPFQVEALPFPKGPEGNTVLTIIVKGTFDIIPDEAAKVSSEQIPIAYGDEFYNEDGGSVRFEADIVPFKPRADIVLVGRAYAPADQEVRVLDVSLRVGNVTRTIKVFGDRHWECGSRLLPAFAADPEPFQTMELVYERAFGGIDVEGGDWCKENPIGCGFFAKKSKKAIDNARLPNIEDPGNLIRYWDDHPTPVGFGFYGRTWVPRGVYLGTYDEKWRKERSPDLPEDFRFDYYNGAHPNLQAEGYLKGNEEVDLVNLTPDGRTLFRLPGISVSAIVSKTSQHETGGREGDIEKIALNLDTQCLIPDEKRFYLVWRGLCSINDLTAIEVSRIEVSMISMS